MLDCGVTPIHMQLSQHYLWPLKSFTSRLLPFSKRYVGRFDLEGLLLQCYHIYWVLLRLSFLAPKIESSIWSIVLIGAICCLDRRLCQSVWKSALRLGEIISIVLAEKQLFLFEVVSSLPRVIKTFAPAKKKISLGV